MLRRETIDDLLALDARMSTESLKVAMLGCGVVGSEVVRLIEAHARTSAHRIGAPIEIVGIAVRRPQRARDLPSTRRCSPPTREALVAREDLDVVIEVIGGIEPARSLLVTALERGVSVVTANKALLAEDGGDAVRRRPPRQHRSLLRGERRRCDPAAAAAA